ncbi:hypothetical protein BC628DRAFT_927848 [Trametes gibbosa]|nr:hypothetical protein BC628DRAFT_927848 [Trametes gibbosa]
MHQSRLVLSCPSPVAAQPCGRATAQSSPCPPRLRPRSSSEVIKHVAEAQVQLERGLVHRYPLRKNMANGRTRTDALHDPDDVHDPRLQTEISIAAEVDLIRPRPYWQAQPRRPYVLPRGSTLDTLDAVQILLEPSARDRRGWRARVSTTIVLQEVVSSELTVRRGHQWGEGRARHVLQDRLDIGQVHVESLDVHVALPWSTAVGDFEADTELSLIRLVLR